MEVLAIIPARGGSKGIHKKNMAELCGQPLLKYTFDAVKDSSLVNRVILSTDDADFARYAGENKVEVMMRPGQLASDTALVKDTINYHLDELEKSGYKPDIFILLQPTSPLRTGKHIDEALKGLMDDETADAVVSVREVPHEYLPLKIMSLDESGALKFYTEGGESYVNRQGLPKFYARNGAAVYAVYTDVFRKTGSFYGTRCIPYLMEAEDSIDIDTPLDLFFAECILKKREVDRA